MNDRRKMEALDWVNASMNLLIGALLGSAMYGLVQLVASGWWLMAVILVALAAGVFLFMILVDKLFESLFKTGIRQMKAGQPQGPKPLLRILSLPAGLVLGMALALLGLDRTILNLVP